MSSTTKTFVSASEVLENWKQELYNRVAPVRYPLGRGALADIDVGPGRVALLGGSPGAGKTALVMQGVIDALRLTADLRVMVANVEMPPAVLMDRQLARLSGVDLKLILDRQLGEEHEARINTGITALEAICPRLAFMKAPFELMQIAQACDQFRAGLLIVDYVQRIGLDRVNGDTRVRINEIMNRLRQLADQGMAVIAVAAVGRVRDERGRTSYDGENLNLSSFRESSELEYGADDAFLLHQARRDPDGDLMTLRHLKSRYGACQDRQLRFDRPHQHFALAQAPEVCHD